MEGTNDISREHLARDHHLQPRRDGPTGRGRGDRWRSTPRSSPASRTPGSIPRTCSPTRSTAASATSRACARGGEADPYEVFRTTPNLFPGYYSRWRTTPWATPTPPGYDLLARVFFNALPGDRHRAARHRHRHPGQRRQPTCPRAPDRHGRLGLRQRDRPRQHLPAGQRRRDLRSAHGQLGTGQAQPTSRRLPSPAR